MDASDDQALTALLDAFGAAFSIDEIAAAYRKSGRNAAAAADALALSDDIANIKTTSFSSKTKNMSASMGTVSGVLGKQYVSKTATDYKGKAMRVDMKAKVLPAPEIWAAEVEAAEKAESCGSGDDVLHKHMEDFLFTMLGEGFELERDLIRDVLDSCGYDMEKSMADLISLSTMESDGTKEVTSNFSNQSADSCLEVEVYSQGENIKSTEINGDRARKKNGVELNGKEKERIDLQKELLAALFSAPKNLEEPKVSRESVVVISKGYANYGNLVDGPLKETFLDNRTPVVYQQNRTEDDAGEEERYQALRRSVKEYRSTMKEYYQAAVEAFSKGDRVRAAKLVEQGQFFQKKSRDADEESNKMIFKPGNAETQENIVLDLQEGGTKEAIRLLKCHLSSFAGISSIKHLKAIVDSKEGGSKKGTRRRLAVLRLLDEESIKWVEEDENAGTLLIQMDSINPKKLKFLKKSS